MDMAYQVCVAGVEDLERVVALERRIETAPHWGLADYLAALPSKNRTSDTTRCLFVAESGDAIVGFAVGKMMSVETDVSAELESVGVAQHVRRFGVGKALCEAVLEWAREMGAEKIELEVRSRSVGPIALYDGLGFAAVGRRAKYYREPVDDAVLMRLDLASHAMQVVPDGRDL